MVDREVLGLAVVGVALLGLALAVSFTPPAPSRGNLPILGPPIAVAVPAETSTPSGTLYNFSVQSAGDGLRWSSLAFELVSAAGAIVTHSGTGWSLVVAGAAGDPIATYDLQSSPGGWGLGGSVAVLAGQSIDLLAPTGSSLTGDALIISNAGAGSVSVSIP